MARPSTFIILLISFIISSTFTIPDSIAMPKGSSSGGGKTISGKVLESMNAAGYTYLLVATSAGEKWVAIPETNVETGAAVSYLDGMVMRDFESKSLKRTFASIVFSPGLAQASTTASTTASAPPASNDSFAAAIAQEQNRKNQPAPIPEVSGGSIGAVVPFNEISVEKADSSNGYNVGEIFAKAKDLNGKTVQVRGKVVKFSPQIMGRNWVHVQDGTGDPMQNTHDLVITTNDSLEVGQVSLLEGTLAADKDFGAGYKYQVIIESASIIK